LPRIYRSPGNRLRLRLWLLALMLAVLLVLPLPSSSMMVPRLMLARMRLPVMDLMLRLIPCSLLRWLPPRLQKRALVRTGRLLVRTNQSRFTEGGGRRGATDTWGHWYALAPPCAYASYGLPPGWLPPPYS